jgi:hypothetical protein
MITDSIYFVCRIDPESKVYCFKQPNESERQKLFNNIIKTCMDNSAEFTVEVLKECLTTLIADPVLVNSFMRTLIISFNQHPGEMKKFTLVEMVPILVRKRVWSSKSVWDGVLMAMKALASHRDAEPSLRAMLCLPGTQLQTLLKMKEVRGALAKCLRGLSAEEKAEVLSGRWAGFEENPADLLKKKLLEELAGSE